MKTLKEGFEMANALLQELKETILTFQPEKAVEVTKKVLEAGIEPVEAVNVMGEGLNELGDRFQAMEVFLPEILEAASAFKKAMTLLEPEILKNAKDRAVRPKVVIGTVKGDVHTVGKDMVAIMLTVGGFDVKDLGADVDPSVFINEAQAWGADIIAASALMSTTVVNQKEIIIFLEAKHLRQQYKFMVGGGPCSSQWAESIGADGYGKDAVSAVEAAQKLVNM